MDGHRSMVKPASLFDNVVIELLPGGKVVNQRLQAFADQRVI
jgi:hypothetical protein